MEKTTYSLIPIFFLIIQTIFANHSIDDVYQYIHVLDKNKSQLMLVFDIDDTVLSNKEFINFHGEFSIPNINANHHRANLLQMRETHELYRWAVNNHIKVAFLTYRCESARLPTMKNLYQQGYRYWDQLILFQEPCNYHEISAMRYKSNERKKLSEQGYYIVASIGDQVSDLQGGFADLQIKLDDPGYQTK